MTAIHSKRLDTLHRELRVWENYLRFCRDETAIFSEHLAEIVKESKVGDQQPGMQAVRDDMDAFESLSGGIEEEICQHAHHLASFARQHGMDAERTWLADHQALRSRMKKLMAQYDGLRRDYFMFATDWK